MSCSTVLCKSNAKSNASEKRRKFARKFERKFTAFRAIIHWNKGRYFVEFSVPHRNFAIIRRDISLGDTRNFTWNRIVVLQRSCKVLHATDTIGWSCNLHEIYFDNCLKLCAVIYHVYLSVINEEDKTQRTQGYR